MSFRIKGLDPAPFLPLYGLSDDALAAQCILPSVADGAASFPDRVELRDAAPGERVLLLNYTHQPANTPYRASHAIFVREGATEAYDRVGEIPSSLSRRLLSVRAFGEDHRMVDADVIEGGALETLIERFLAKPDVAYLHAHYAKRGCYAARIERT